MTPEQRADVEKYLQVRAERDPFRLFPSAMDFMFLSDAEQQAALKEFAAEQVVALAEELTRLDETKAAVAAELAHWAAQVPVVVGDEEGEVVPE